VFAPSRKSYTMAGESKGGRARDGLYQKTAPESRLHSQCPQVGCLEAALNCPGLLIDQFLKLFRSSHGVAEPLFLPTTALMTSVEVE